MRKDKRTVKKHKKVQKSTKKDEFNCHKYVLR